MGPTKTKQSGAGRAFDYNGGLGRWWLRRCSDAAHARAYVKIADFIRASYVREPELIVDYACGTCCLLALLSRRFRRSRLVGLDGSSFLLGLALRRIVCLPADCSRRISLIETSLPNFSLMLGRADLAIFCFPNMVPYPGRDTDASKGRLDVLERGRRISLNLRRLLARDGICVRIEYATMQRHELDPEELRQVSYEEGSLSVETEGRRPRPWFRVVASSYFRSQVLRDVYEQTGDERDTNGGYLITVLRSV